MAVVCEDTSVKGDAGIITICSYLCINLERHPASATLMVYVNVRQTHGNFLDEHETMAGAFNSLSVVLAQRGRFKEEKRKNAEVQ
ncbi:unnamed protein product [Clonostachys rosea f. rosea IK726]|uniref:Uncharacterized protein n=1 Tax=Clonostachys rosea f. rosea IK726 TaxID=1349383 RepID=A0ACA9U9Z6_BIOOC|nr:unnamed protein product [Clonostachys rosea f. rosea IK726]